MSKTISVCNKSARGALAVFVVGAIVLFGFVPVTTHADWIDADTSNWVDSSSWLDSSAENWINSDNSNWLNSNEPNWINADQSNWIDADQSNWINADQSNWIDADQSNWINADQSNWIDADQSNWINADQSNWIDADQSNWINADRQNWIDDQRYVGSDGALYTYDKPSYGGASSGGSYSSGSYSSGGSTYSRPSTVTISSPKVSFTPTTIGYPVTIGYPTTIAKPANTTITKPAKTTGSGSYTSYYTDNSINDSYNVTTITKVTDKQQTIQYVYTPSCSIYATPNSISANQVVTLTWSSQNASTAYLTNHGSVLVSGSLSVNPSQTTTYTLMVYNTSGQAANCQTTVYVNTYVPPVTQYPSCTLSANPSYIQNGAYSILSWTSQNAVSARLSDGLGNVALNGSLSVRPESNRTYSLTVTDSQGRTNVCNSNVVVSGSYISLSQIPYTGFDFGPFGNAMYWLVLALLAGGSAYIVLFYRGGMVNVVRETFAMLVPAAAGISGAAIHTNTQREEMDVQTRNDYRVSVEDLPVRQSEAVRATKDAMTVIKSKTGEAPRIVISRN